MNTIAVILIVTAVLAIYAGMYWLDDKHGYQWVKWSNGQVDSPFAPKGGEDKDALKARIETLEAIVTDRKYQLDEEIRRL